MYYTQGEITYEEAAKPPKKKPRNKRETRRERESLKGRESHTHTRTTTRGIDQGRAHGNHADTRINRGTGLHTERTPRGALSRLSKMALIFPGTKPLPLILYNVRVFHVALRTETELRLAAEKRIRAQEGHDHALAYTQPPLPILHLHSLVWIAPMHVCVTLCMLHLLCAMARCVHMT
jgi:hypothetical protein